MDTHYKDYLLRQEGEKLPVEHCIFHTDGWFIRKDIHDELTRILKEGTTVRPVQKETFGCYKFASSKEFKYSQTDTIYICGFCTDICVVSNALLLKSTNTETPIYLIEDCCAGTTPENHKAAIQVLQSCQVNILE